MGANPLGFVDPTGEYGIAGAIIGAGFNTISQVGLNLLASDFDWRRSLLCVDLADIVLSAALGAAGPGLGNVVKKSAEGAIFTQSQNIFLYAFMIQPVSVGSKRTFNLRVDDLIDEECNDNQCEELAIPEALNALKLLQL